MARVKKDILNPQQKLRSTEKRSTKTNRNMKLFFQDQKHWLFSGRNRVDLVRRLKKKPFTDEGLVNVKLEGIN